MKKLSYSPMVGKPNHCTMAQVWDEDGKNLAVIDSRLGEEKATYYAKLFSKAPEMLEMLEKIKYHIEVDAIIELYLEIELLIKQIK